MIRNLVLRNLGFAALAVFLAASVAQARDQFDGLDLTDDSSEPKPDEAQDGLDLTTPQPATPAPTPAAPQARAPDATTSATRERDITQEDRVKSVQRKLYMKRHRFELAPYLAVNVNDPFYTKMGGALRAAFYPHDTLAISARFTLLSTSPTDDVRIAKRTFNSRIFFSVPEWTLLADAEWSAIYGKVAIFNSILHFDGYLLAGAGVVYTETSGSDDASRAGVKPAFDLGLGLRFITTDWLAVNVSLINTTYIDVPAGSAKGSTQNVMLVNAGVSIFFPFKSTFREAE